MNGKKNVACTYAEFRTSHGVVKLVLLRASGYDTDYGTNYYILEGEDVLIEQFNMSSLTFSDVYVNCRGSEYRLENLRPATPQEIAKAILGQERQT